MAKKEKNIIETKFLNIKNKFKAGGYDIEEMDHLTCDLIAHLAQLTDNGVTEVEGVSITNLSFSPEFDKAIEEKQVAEQRSLKAKFEQDKAKTDSQTQIIKAQAEGEKQRLLQKSLDQRLLSKMWIEKWDGKLPTYMLGNQSSLLLNIPQSAEK